MEWPLSFHHRAAQTIDELREVLDALAIARRQQDAEPHSLEWLVLRNQLWSNVECYAAQYATALLSAIEYLKGKAMEEALNGWAKEDVEARESEIDAALDAFLQPAGPEYPADGGADK